eukprot:1713457-Heterocapsa_arctica.AAC.1
MPMWTLVAPSALQEFAASAESKLETYTPVSKHSPVRLNIGGRLSEGMGKLIRRPMEFQDYTRKEATNIHINQGYSKTKGSDLNEK